MPTDVKISELPASFSVNPSDLFVVVDITSAPVTKKVAAQYLAALSPVQSVAGKTGAVTITKIDVGLGNVDNTTDAGKPISAATQTALDGKASVAHKSRHALGGADPLTPSDIGAVASDEPAIAGAVTITNIIKVTQDQYDAIVAPSVSTLYVIVD
jgi:hypothetical protein